MVSGQLRSWKGWVPIVGGHIAGWCEGEALCKALHWCLCMHKRRSLRAVQGAGGARSGKGGDGGQGLRLGERRRGKRVRCNHAACNWK